MSKIKRITVSNFKAVSDMTADFNGCSAIITGGNNKGKSSFLRGVMDRIRGLKPDMIVKQGESEMHSEIELTTGEKFTWDYKDGKEKLFFITSEEIKAPVTKNISEKFFPSLFDIDKFLTSTPKIQKKMLQDLTGVDFTEIEQDYKEAYDNRTFVNRKFAEEKAKINATEDLPEKIEKVSIDDLLEEKGKIRSRLNSIYLNNKGINSKKRDDYDEEMDKWRDSKKLFEMANSKKEEAIKTANSLLNDLRGIGYKGKEVSVFISSMPKPDTFSIEKPMEPEYIKELPDDSELKEIDQQIANSEKTNEKAREWERYQELLKAYTQAETKAKQADQKVKEIELKKLELIKSANLPDGFEFDEEGVKVDGLPVTKEQLSSSKLYINALKLAYMKLGRVKALHFDASHLDKNSLSEIEYWANDNGLQLLIERPDFEGGEITYQILES